MRQRAPRRGMALAGASRSESSGADSRTDSRTSILSLAANSLMQHAAEYTAVPAAGRRACGPTRPSLALRVLFSVARSDRIHGMSTSPSTPVLPAGLPENWALDRDVYCPTCRYNLRLLRLPRCPECGLVFRWQALLQVACPRCAEALGTTDGDTCPRCRLHLDWPRLLEDGSHYDRTLFEYTDRPVRAAVSTWAAALRPRRFWRRIPLEVPPVLVRLRWLRRVAVGSTLLGLALLALLNWLIAGGVDFDGILVSCATVFILPLMTTIGLPMFTPTLSRFQVRRDQLLRCLTYACSGLFWIGVGCMCGFLYGEVVNTILASPSWRVVLSFPPRGDVKFDPVDVLEWLVWGNFWWSAWRYPAFGFNVALAVVVLPLCFVWWWLFLYASLRHYLRLDRGNAIALFASTQIIGLLALLIALMASRSAMAATGILLLRLESLLRGATPAG
jgi:hypothetical protein